MTGTGTNDPYTQSELDDLGMEAMFSLNDPITCTVTVTSTSTNDVNFAFYAGTFCAFTVTAGASSLELTVSDTVNQAHSESGNQKNWNWRLECRNGISNGAVTFTDFTLCPGSAPCLCPPKPSPPPSPPPPSPPPPSPPPSPPPPSPPPPYCWYHLPAASNTIINCQPHLAASRTDLGVGGNCPTYGTLDAAKAACESIGTYDGVPQRCNAINYKTSNGQTCFKFCSGEPTQSGYSGTFTMAHFDVCLSPPSWLSPKLYKWSPWLGVVMVP